MSILNPAYRDRLWARWYRNFGPYCVYCNCRIYPKIDQRVSCIATLDHVLPRALGGRNSTANLAWACKECNHKKDASINTSDVPVLIDMK